MHPDSCFIILMIQIKEKRIWIWLSNICLRTGVTEAHVIALAGYRPGKATPKSIETLDTWELWGAVNIITTSVCLSIYLPSYVWCDCKLATWRFDASGFACVGVCWFQIPTCCKTDSHLCEAGSAYLDSYDRFFFHYHVSDRINYGDSPPWNACCFRGI